MTIPALVIGLTMMGDTLLYAVLPLYAAEFGVSLFVVGILLSLNRWVRLVANSVVAELGRRVNPRGLMRVAATTATISTLGYVLAPSEAVLMAARVLWGLSYAALNLAMLAYAVADRANAGKRVGAGRTSIGFFQGAALIGGTLLVASMGPRGVFLVMAACSAIGAVLAFLLPPLEMGEEKSQPFRLPVPGRLEIWGFALGLIVDGIFLITLSLLLADQTLPVATVVATGILLATRWGMEVLTAPIGGALADRFGATTLCLLSGGALVIGLGFVATRHDLIGAVLIVTTRGLFNTLLPVMVAERARGGMLSSQATYATWRDFGAAVGPVVAGAAFATIAQPMLYGTSAAVLAILLWWCLGRRG